MIHKSAVTGFETITHQVDFCVVGGGLAGMFAAIAAARHGSRVLLMQDRPVLGGNASSEIRMWIRGAHGENNRETGLLEEIALENVHRNPEMNFSVWDSVLYEKVKFQENLEVLLNCSCCTAEMDGQKILSITGWQGTTQKWHKVNATLFADCSGDSVLAPLTGAEYRMGRESREEFGEDIAPVESDSCTMGMSCLFQVRETEKPVSFTPPKWANRYTKEDFKNKLNFSSPLKWSTDNYWWMEIGGVYNSIDDTEKLRDELLKIAYGSWDFIKNSGELESENWALEWMGFLPGKRESRRYVGDYIMTQHDVRAEGRFPDLVAYGGWSMDDHHPKGFETTEPPTIFHPAPSPYGIPYRCLYSKNIDNLLFAGRNISVTHSAMSSCRVMATCGLLGQAMGTAAAIAIENQLSPREVYEQKCGLLQQTLMDDDCYLPFHKREMPTLMNTARLTASGNADLLTDGIERQIGDTDHAWEGATGDAILLTFSKPTFCNRLRLVFDSDLNRRCWENYRWYVRDFVMRCNVFLDDRSLTVPNTLVKSFMLYGDIGDGNWKLLHEETANYQRHLKIPLHAQYQRLKLVPLETWGVDRVRIYGFDVE